MRGVVREVLLQCGSKRKASVALEDGRGKRCTVSGEWPWNPLALRCDATTLELEIDGARRLRHVATASIPEEELCEVGALVDHGIEPACARRMVSAGFRTKDPDRALAYRMAPGVVEDARARLARARQLARAPPDAVRLADHIFPGSIEGECDLATRLSPEWTAIFDELLENPLQFWRLYGTHPLACLDYAECRIVMTTPCKIAEQLHELERQCAARKATRVPRLAGMDVCVATPEGLRETWWGEGDWVWPMRLWKLQRRVAEACVRLLHTGCLTVQRERSYLPAYAPTPRAARAHAARALPASREVKALQVVEAHLLGLEEADTLLQHVERLVLVGDPEQLGPFGIGDLFRELALHTRLPRALADTSWRTVVACPLRWIAQHRPPHTVLCHSLERCDAINALYRPDVPPAPHLRTRSWVYGAQDRIVALANLRDDVVSGSLGIVVRVTAECLDAKFGDSPPVRLTRAEVSGLIRPGWAVTIRRIQGGPRLPHGIVAGLPGMSWRALLTAHRACARTTCVSEDHVALRLRAGEMMEGEHETGLRATLRAVSDTL